jgi:hypothetical protein
VLGLWQIGSGGVEGSIESCALKVEVFGPLSGRKAEFHTRRAPGCEPRTNLINTKSQHHSSTFRNLPRCTLFVRKTEARDYFQHKTLQRLTNYRHPILWTHQNIMNVDTIPDFLEQTAGEAHSDLQPAFLEFEDLWERKLWHQLTDALVQFFNHKESASQRLPMYNKFILSFADKINQLKLVTLALSASLQCRSK